MNSKTLAMGSYCLTGVSLTILIQLENGYQIEEGGIKRKFYHPLMQTQMMIIGELLCFCAYMYYRYIKKQIIENSENNKKPAKFYIAIIPVLLDLTASYCIFIAKNFITGSASSIMGGAVVVTTAIFSRIILSIKMNRFQIIGCILTVLGAGIVGFGESFKQQSAEANQNFILGLALLLVAYLIQGYLFSLTQKIYLKYQITPLNFVGLQGLIGSIIWTIIIIIVQFVPCPLATNKCVIDLDGEPRLESVSVFFIELGDHWFLLVSVIIYILVIARFNFDLGKVIVQFSALAMTMIRLFSDCFVWIIGIILTLIGQAADNNQIKIESLDLLVNGVKLIGFILTALGLLIYNQIILKNMLASFRKQSISKGVLLHEEI